ncbi:MAG: peptidoglycan DD-metalloendopeptidase family protein [Casimicrobiaceae bacterium]
MTNLPRSQRVLTVMTMAALTVLAGCASRPPAPAPVVDRGVVVPPPELAPVPPPAPPAPQPAAVPEKDWRPEFYTVKRGDTLFGVALEHGLDYRELASMNNIENINLIRLGQVLRLRPPGDPAMSGPGSATPPPEARPIAPATAQSGRGNTDTYKTGPKAVKLPFSDAAMAQLMANAPRSDSGSALSAGGSAATSAAAGTPSSAIPPVAALVPPTSSAPPPAAPALSPSPSAAAAQGDDRVDWAWPVRGKIISSYSETASLKGIDIGGATGAPIMASAPGKVVYAGSGLRGYGKLVIVKHNKTYLSAYAHLDQISVKEGQNVGKGQELGRMGSSDADQTKLHFEIRSLGKPVDPMRYLPRG